MFKPLLKERKRPFPHYRYPDETTITYEQLGEKDAAWYGVPAGSWKLHADSGFFPTILIAGVIQQKFNEGAELSQHTGWKRSINTGTGTEVVLNLQNTLSLLRAMNYIVIEKAK